MNSNLLLALTLGEKDEKVELRVPGQLKHVLKREAKKKGFGTLSKYLLAIILGRNDSK